MKKTLFFVIFIFFTLALTAQVKESKKIYKLQKAYIYLDEDAADFGNGPELFLFYQGQHASGYQVIASSQPDRTARGFLR